MNISKPKAFYNGKMMHQRHLSERISTAKLPMNSRNASAQKSIIRDVLSHNKSYDFRELDLSSYLSSMQKDLSKHGITLPISPSNETAKTFSKTTTGWNPKPARAKNNKQSVNDLNASPKKVWKTPSPQLNSFDSINWLKKRHNQTAKAHYLKTKNELEKDQEIVDVFQKIDYDCSGKIDVQELHSMFLQNGVEMSRDEIECFFDLCQSQSRGYLTFDEFKDLYANRSADELFRFYIKRARKVNQELQKEGIRSVYLPFNLSRLLEHMSLKARRETVHARIEGCRLQHDKTVETVKNFVKLFIIDQGAIETISRDEWSVKINAARERAEFEEKKKLPVGKRFTSNPTEDVLNQQFSLRRLDSLHLNQLTAKAFDRRGQAPAATQQSPAKIGKSASLKPGFAGGLHLNLKRASPVKDGDDDDSDGSSPSPVRKLGAMKLEAIDETDSFCTDSSYVCSPDFFKSSPNGRGNAASREAFHRWDKEDPKIGEIKEEDSEEGDVEELKVKRNVQSDKPFGGKLLKLTKTELEPSAKKKTENDNEDEDGSPLKQDLRNPQQINMSISDMIMQARKEGFERAQKDIREQREPLTNSCRTMPKNSQKAQQADLNLPPLKTPPQSRPPLGPPSSRGNTSTQQPAAFLRTFTKESQGIFNTKLAFQGFDLKNLNEKPKSLLQIRRDHRKHQSMTIDKKDIGPVKLDKIVAEDIPPELAESNNNVGKQVAQIKPIYSKVYRGATISPKLFV